MTNGKVVDFGYEAKPGNRDPGTSNQKMWFFNNEAEIEILLPLESLQMKLDYCNKELVVKILCTCCGKYIERNAFNSKEAHKNCLLLGAKSHPKEERLVWSCGYCKKLYDCRSFMPHFRTEHKEICEAIREGEQEAMSKIHLQALKKEAAHILPQAVPEA